MKILLVWPKSRGDLYAIAEPLALEYLAAGLQLDGHEIKILDLRLHPQGLNSYLQDFNPDVVGITAFSMHVRAGLSICQQVKNLLPDCITIAGGHHATLLPMDFFEPQIDYVVVGEGIQPFRTLLRQLESADKDKDVAGVWRRSQQNGKFHFGGSQPTFEIDALPLPDRSLTLADRSSYFIDWMKPIALVRTSVGCPYSCTFCSLWKIMDHRYHKRDVDMVVEEMATIKEDFVFLVDDEAFIDGPRMLRLARALKAAGIYKRYFAYCRMDTLIRQREVLEAWVEIGLERLFVGIDAISSKDLHEFNKKLELEQIENGLTIANKLGLKLFTQFVVNTDYEQADFKNLLDFIQQHDLEYPTFTVLTPIPGTNLLLPNFENVVEKQANGRPNWDLFDCQNVVTKTRLPKNVFMSEYWKLYKTFKDRYMIAKENGIAAAERLLANAAL
jgi:radical SAM superfamily enzyme YgiQ (UPF0313 family)